MPSNTSALSTLLNGQAGADAWTAAMALKLDATLSHKNPEFKNLPVQYVAR
jgi:predicted nucleic acid-binding protein